MDEQLQKLVQCIFETHHDGDIDCETCGQQLNCLAELVTSGADLHVLLPAVEAHLGCCRDCREEFNALMAIIRAEQQGLLTTSDEE